MFRIKVVEKIKTHVLCSVTVFEKSCHLWDNMEKYCRDGAGGGWQYGASALLAAHLRLQIHTLTLCTNLFFFHYKSGYRNSPQCYVTPTLSVLLLNVFLFLVQYSPDSPSPEGSMHCFLPSRCAAGKVVSVLDTEFCSSTYICVHMCLSGNTVPSFSCLLCVLSCIEDLSMYSILTHPTNEW